MDSQDTERPEPMRERILGFLRMQEKPLAADAILREVLGIRSPNTATADRVLEALIRGDPRFLKVKGFWSALPGPTDRPDSRLTGAAVIFIEQSTGTPSEFLVRGAAIIPETGFLARIGLAADKPENSVLLQIDAALENRALVTWGRRELQLWRRYLSRCRAPAWNGECLQLRSLAGRVLGLRAADLNIEVLSAALDLPPPEPEDPAAMVRSLARCWHALLDRVPEEHRRNHLRLLQWIDAGRDNVDFGRFEFRPEFLRGLPGSSGVYVMRNRAREIIYVGKSRNLRRRVRSYFTPGSLRDPKARKIHEQLYTIEVIPTENEVEALLLEMSMIRDFKPHINLQEEVHDSAAYFGRQWNCLLLIPRPQIDVADIYMLRDGAFIAHASARLRSRAGRRLAAKLKSVYFVRQKSGRKRAEPWETEIVSRWLRINKARVNYIDIDDAGTCDNAIRLLNSCLADPDGLVRKVHYR